MTCKLQLLAAALVLATAGIADAQQTQIQRGEYLARAGDCISCHTAKDGAPFAGGLRMNTPFGYLLSPNITPDQNTGIGRWSADEFYRAMKEGINKRGQDMFPVMPFDFYTKVTREDSDAIYAYLKTVKPVDNHVDVNHLRFPFNQRWSMAVWRELYFDPAEFRHDTTRSAAWNRGAYLVEGLGHCSSCHSPRNALGGIEKDKAFTGATIDGWFALNLTAELHTGLGSWTEANLATYLRTGAYEGRTTVFGPMTEVVQNSLQHMTDADLQAMAEYLKSLPANSSLRAGKPVPDESRQRGAALYLDHCGGCHQAKGRGIPNVFPALAGNGAVVAADPANIVQVTLQGIPARGSYIPMPSFETQLNDQQIADLVNYVRTSWGNTAAANATAAIVRKLRGEALTQK